MSRDPAYLLDILLACQKVQQFTAGMTREEFEQEEIIQLAIIKLVEIIGEASRALSQPLKDAHPEIPWHAIIGMRHRLIHEYFKIDLAEVWKTVEADIPHLIPQIEALVRTYNAT